MRSLIEWEHQLTEIRASIFSLIAENAGVEHPLPLEQIVTYAVGQHQVPETVAKAAIDDLVSFGLVSLLPEGAILSALSGRLAK